jgi:hypothetical protein
MWFLVLTAFMANGAEQPRLELAMAAPHYANQATCLVEGIKRTNALASVGIHGQFLCMYHGEPDRELRHSAIWKY